MIQFYRIQTDCLRVPRGQPVLVAEWQRENRCCFEEYDYQEPGWYLVSRKYQDLCFYRGELIGLTEAPTEKQLSCLKPQVAIEKKARTGLTWDALNTLNSEAFQLATGTSFCRFHYTTTALTCAHWKKKQRGGRKEQMGIEEYLYLTLFHQQGKSTYEALAQAYGIGVTRIHEIVKWVEAVLGKR